jgi:succinate dehydrogenase/fumarate reductase flavoprotein subunit
LENKDSFVYLSEWYGRLKMKTKHIQADVLCVGGGIGGLMAAIRASELGARVVVAEKGNTIHSGKGGGGCDHYLCYMPEAHGKDMGS